MIPKAPRGSSLEIPTAREVNALLAFAEHGEIEAAGKAIGIDSGTLRNELLSLRRKLDANSTLQAYHRLIGGVSFVEERTMQLRRVAS